MDFANQAYAQFMEVYQGMTGSARAVTVVLLIAVITSFVMLFSYGNQNPDEALFGGAAISQADMVEMSRAFSDAGLNDHDMRGSQMYVPRGQRNLYEKALEGMTFSSIDPFAINRQAVQSGSMFESSERYKDRRLAFEDMRLAQRIQSMPNIMKADVKVSETSSGRFGGGRDMSAILIVTGTGGRPIDPQLAERLRSVVAGSRAGLDASKVTVLDTHGKVYDGSTARIWESPYVVHKMHHERAALEKIYTALGDIDGLRAQVSIELTTELGTSTRSTTYDQTKSATVSNSESTQSEQRTRAAAAGVPGFNSNGGLESNAPNQVSSGRGGNDETSEKTEAKTVSVPSRQTKVLSEAGLIPRSGRAAISIPRSYLRKHWKINNPPAEGEEAKEPTAQDLADVETQVKNRVMDTVRVMIPAPPTQNAKDPHVSVEFYEDGIQPAMPPSPGFATTALGWLDRNWQTLGMMGIGVFALMMFRSMVKSAQAAEEAAQAQLDQQQQLSGVTPPSSDGPEVETDPDRVLNPNDGGPDIREELLEMVQRNPDAAVNKLRSWLSEVV